MGARFPKRRADGSFSVSLDFEVDNAVVRVTDVSDWLDQWVKEHSEWIWSWQSGKTETLRLRDAFVSGPYVVASCPAMIRLRLDATPAAPYWRDWYVKLVSDIRTWQPSMRFVGIQNTDDSTEV
jgi:hypothetical protein